MLVGKRIVVVMPAYHAGRTLEATWRDLPHDIVDKVIVVDDASDDDTVAVARALGLEVILHPRNIGYGGNQKTCYPEALARGADIVVMVHPDYQYDPRLVTAMAGMIASGIYDMVLGSRISGRRRAARAECRMWKYVANRALTLFENVLMGAHLSEYHTGYRAYSRDAARRAAVAAQFRRLRLRQRDPRAGDRRRLPHRRGVGADALFRRGELGDLRAVGALRLRRARAWRCWASLARTGLYRHRLFTPGGSLPAASPRSARRR